MELKKINDRIFYCSHEAKTDRPMLVYLNGDKIKVVIDAGASKAHVEEFYDALTKARLQLPDFTVLTHWHWDHSYGLHAIHGLSIAHTKTNEYLLQEQVKVKDSKYIVSLKENNEYFLNEYNNNQKIIISLADIEFDSTLFLELGNMKLELFHTVSPHSDDTVLIYVASEKILFLGDATFGDYFNDFKMDFAKLEKLKQTINNIDCKYCIISHDEPLTKEELLLYLNSIQ